MVSKGNPVKIQGQIYIESGPDGFIQENVAEVIGIIVLGA